MNLLTRFCYMPVWGRRGCGWWGSVYDFCALAYSIKSVINRLFKLIDEFLYLDIFRCLVYLFFDSLVYNGSPVTFLSFYE